MGIEETMKASSKDLDVRTIYQNQDVTLAYVSFPC